MANDSNESSVGSPSFEHALAELETIMHELEEGKLGLAEGLARYERGVGLLKQCYELLERAERKIELLCGVDASGNPITQQFDEGQQTLDEKAQARSRRRSATKAPRSSESPPPAENDDQDMPGSLF